jgi:hypothetical protein
MMKPMPTAISLALLAAAAAAQQLELLPPGPFVAQCRGASVVPVDIFSGGDDDNVNIWFIDVDTSVHPTGPGADLYIHLWDGDLTVQTDDSTGKQDVTAVGSPGMPFEYRLYGGPGAAIDDDVVPGRMSRAA